VRGRRIPLDIVAVGLVILAVGVLAVLRNDAQQRARPKPDSYASTDYAPGGLRAWRTLLEREGIATAAFTLRPDALEGRIDTLIVAVPNADPGTWTALDQAHLLRWVRGGGHVVLLDYGSSGDGMALFAPRRPGRAAPAVRTGAPQGAFSGAYAAEVRALMPRGAGRYLPETAEERRNVLLADARGALVIRLHRGRGTIVLANDPAPFTNRSLANADDARLAVLLGRPARAGALVAFDDALHGSLAERPWWRALPPSVDAALGIGAFAFVLWLIASLVRNGRPLPGVPPREPTSAEFVAALAALYERTAARRYAAGVLDADAVATAARALGLAADVDPQVLVARTAERRGGRDLERLIAERSNEPRTDRELVARAHTAYTVRKEFLHGQGGRSRAAFDGGTRARRRR
jgi:hypothetical protein